jgi:DNA-binding NtrC family response regulator
MTQERILIIDDDDNIRFAFKKAFRKKGFEVIEAEDGIKGFNKIKNEDPSIIFMDISMPGCDGLAVLQRIKEANIETPIIMITGQGTMSTAVKSIQLGAYEYIVKPLDLEKIFTIADRAIETNRLRVENLHLKKQFQSTNDDEIIGSHPKMQEVFKSIGKISTSPNTTTVLITGESGTGKELVARAIHKTSKKSNAPFIGINCAVFPNNLLESELFGHEKGSFTGAESTKIGKFEASKNGTIFLDEIGEMDIELQGKLLRVLQEREYYRVGGTKLIKVHSRIIASTNRDLELEIKNRNFRQDLFYRLNVISLTVPPLRDHMSDLEPLIDFFLKENNKKLGKSIVGISKDAQEKLSKHSFRGNVRELEHLIEHAMTYCQSYILSSHDFPEIVSDNNFSLDVKNSSLVLSEARDDFNVLFEKHYIKNLLTHSKGSISKASELAQVNRKTIQRMVKKYNIDKTSFK